MSAQNDFQSATVPNEIVNLAFDNAWSAARAWREYLNLTQTAVAKRMKVTLSTLVKFETSGARLPKATRKKLAAALGLTSHQLAW